MSDTGHDEFTLANAGFMIPTEGDGIEGWQSTFDLEVEPSQKAQVESKHEDLSSAKAHLSHDVNKADMPNEHEVENVQNEDANPPQTSLLDLTVGNMDFHLGDFTTVDTGDTGLAGTGENMEDVAGDRPDETASGYGHDQGANPTSGSHPAGGSMELDASGPQEASLSVAALNFGLDTPMAEVTTDEGALPQEKGLSEAGMDVQKQVQKNTLSLTGMEFELPSMNVDEDPLPSSPKSPIPELKDGSLKITAKPQSKKAKNKGKSKAVISDTESANEEDYGMKYMTNEFLPHPPEHREVPPAIMPHETHKASVVQTATSLNEFYSANGHHVIESGPVNPANPLYEEESIKSDANRCKQYDAAVRSEEAAEVSWRQLKESTIKFLDGQVVANPFQGRYTYFKPDSHVWVQKVRREVFKASPWDYDQILEDEKALEEAEAGPEVKKFIHTRATDVQMDEEQRRFIWIMLRPIIGLTLTQMEVQNYLDQLFLPNDLSRATPYNNFYLRFPEYCPSSPFLQFRTKDGLHMHHNMLKKKFTQAKTNIKKLMSIQSAEETLTGRSVNKMVLKLMQKVLPGNEHPTGFREYTNDDDYRRNNLQKAVTEEMDRIREAENQPNKHFHSREVFAITENIKRQSWAALSKAEKKAWAAKAKDVEDKLEGMDFDERVNACTKATSIIYHDLAEKANWYQVVYTAFSYGGKAYAGIAEIGKSPLPTLLRTSEFGAASAGMEEAIAKIAAMRTGTSEEEVIRIDLGGNSTSEDNVLETEETTSIPALPPLPINANSPPTKETAKNMMEWLKQCLMLIHSLKSLPPKKLQTIFKDEEKYFKNLAKDANGNDVPLYAFDSMPQKYLVPWIEHLSSSFAEGPQPKNGFRFLTRDGKEPHLTMLRAKEADVSHEASGSKRKPRKPATRKSKRLRATQGKRKKMQTDEDSYGDSDGESVSDKVDSDDEPLGSDGDDESDDDLDLRRVHKRRKLSTKNVVSEPLRAPKAFPGSLEQLAKKAAISKAASTGNENPLPNADPPFTAGTSHCLQTVGMGSPRNRSTFPQGWKSKVWDPSKTHKFLLTRHRQLLDVPPAIKEQQRRLRQIFEGLVLRSEASKEVHFPGLYEAHVHIHFLQEALKFSREDYPIVLELPPFPNPTTSNNELAVEILTTIQDTTLPIPVAMPSIASAFDSIAQELSTPLLKWVSTALAEVSKPSAVDSGFIPYRLALLILRSLWFIHSNVPSLPSDTPETTFMTACNTFGMIACHRYTKSIIKRIVGELAIETANRSKAYRDFVKEVEGYINHWLEYSETIIPDILSKDTTMPIRGALVGADAPPEEAKAILNSFQLMPWWSSTAAEFPQLLQCSATLATSCSLDVLGANRYWDQFDYLDKFGCFIVGLLNCIPTLNSPHIPGDNPLPASTLKRIDDTMVFFEGLKQLIGSGDTGSHERSKARQDNVSTAPAVSGPLVQPGMFRNLTKAMDKEDSAAATKQSTLITFRTPDGKKQEKAAQKVAGRATANVPAPVANQALPSPRRSPRKPRRLDYDVMANGPSRRR